MLKRLFARPSATRPVALHFLEESGPHITLRDLMHHLALIGPVAETWRLQRYLAVQMQRRALPVMSVCTPEDAALPPVPPPTLTLTAQPDRSAQQLARPLRHFLERHTTSSTIPTNLMLYSAHLPVAVARDLKDLMRLWRSGAVYTFTAEQLLSTRMAPYRSKLDTLFASALILPGALSAYQTVGGALLPVVPAGHAVLVIRGGLAQTFCWPSSDAALTPHTLGSGHSTESGHRSPQ